MRALAIAATGMSAQEQNLEVIANNVANINTTGFKRSRAEFTDLIYQTERLMGVSKSKARGPKTNYRRTEEMVHQIVRHRFLDPDACIQCVRWRSVSTLHVRGLCTGAA